ncbi:MAG: hypothetical protein AAF628_37005 [Planctomycetota bacterium]
MRPRHGQQVVAGRVRDPEIEHHRMTGPIAIAPGTDQHVARFEVAVDHTASVGVFDRIADAGDQLDALGVVEPVAVGVRE